MKAKIFMDEDGLRRTAQYMGEVVKQFSKVPLRQ